MKKIFTQIFIASILLISSCSLPAQQAPSDSEISTAAALTVQAMLAAATPLATPTASETPEPPATATATQPPMISVEGVTNCRAGPGTNYDRVAQLVPGQAVEIIGFFPSNYWIVKTANGECWVSAEFATPSGDFGSVPRVDAPPTPFGGAPNAPSFGKNGWTWFCYGSGEVDVELNWKDNSDNEKGFRVYRNEELVLELPAGATYFKETITYPGGQGLQYRVEAFNEAGGNSVFTQVLFCE